MQLFNPVSAWQKVCDLRPIELQGGPLDHNPMRLDEVFMIAWMASNSDAYPAVRFRPDPKIDFSEVEAAAETVDGQLLVGHREGGSRWQSLKDLRDLGTLLGELPEATEIELFTATDEAYGCHRYVGILRGGVWALTHTYPATDKATLIRALKLATADPIELDSEELAEKVEALVEEDFDGTYLRVVRDGRRLQGQMKNEADESVTHMIRPFAFAVVFADGPWPSSVLEEEDDDDDDDDFSLQLSNMFTQPDPPGKELIYAGSFGRFFPSEITQLEHVVAEDRSLLDGEMEALGFKSLGGLCCNKIPGTSMLGYAGGDGAYAVGTASQGGMFVVEFYTAFQDGSSVTTSTNPDVEDIKKKKILRKSFTHLEPAELLAEHRKAVRDRGQQPVVGEASLKGLAQAIDEYLERQGGLFF